MTGFDPIALARACRAEGALSLPVDRPRDGFAPNALGHAGEDSASAILSAWLVGEGARFAVQLDRAIEWLETADQRDERYGDDPVFHAMLRRRALALGRWSRDGDDCRAIWRAAAEAGTAVIAGAPPPLAPHALADHLLDWLHAGEPDMVLAAAARHPGAEGDSEVRTALALADAFRASPPRADAGLMAEAGGLFHSRVGTWLYNGAFMRVAAWCKLAFFDTGVTSDPGAALLMIYPYLPGVPVPPRLADRGWRDAPGDALVTLPPAAALARIGGLAAAIGLARDPDAVARRPDAPEFASWSGRDGDDREVDYHAQADARWLEVRGRDAGVLAGAMAAALQGTIAPDVTSALAELLTAPAGARGANGATRWRILRAAVAAFGEANRPFVQALIRAGLKDPDWRVRMAAVLAIGRLRLASLADGATAAAAPRAGEDGIDQEDRRALLAFRIAAHDRALGLPAGAPASDLADVTARRRDYQRGLHALLNGSADAAWGREAALLAALLDGPEAVRGRVPGAWRGWLGDD
jgi:hypothetical protein